MLHWNRNLFFSACLWSAIIMYGTVILFLILFSNSNLLWDLTFIVFCSFFFQIWIQFSKTSEEGLVQIDFFNFKRHPLFPFSCSMKRYSNLLPEVLGSFVLSPLYLNLFFLCLHYPSRAQFLFHFLLTVKPSPNKDLPVQSSQGWGVGCTQY